MTTPNATQYALLQAESVIEQALNFADDRAFDVLRSYGRLDNLTLHTQEAERLARIDELENMSGCPPIIVEATIKDRIDKLPNPTEAGEK